MYYFEYFVSDSNSEFLVLEPEDWTEDEWKTLLKLFGLTEAERIVVRDFTLQCYGTPKPNLSELIKRQRGK